MRREDFAGGLSECLSWIGEHKKIRLFQARPLKFRGAQGAGFNKHHFNTNSLVKKNNDGQINYKSAIIPSEHMKGV